MQNPRSKIRLVVAVLVTLVSFGLFVISLRTTTQPLKVVLLNIGQGDAIYIKSPTGREIMIDGGPDRSVLKGLGRVMPFYDRSIDALIISNPDKDHFAGFIDILRSYKVNLVVEPGTVSETAVYHQFESDVAEGHIQKIIAHRGTVLDLGGGAVLTFLFPDRDASTLRTNDGSLVARLTYGKTSVLLMGDAPDEIEKYLVELDGSSLKSDVLKVGHHGSKTSTSRELLAAVKPAYAAITAGVKNKYGHPHAEVINRLEEAGIKILGTYQKSSDVIFFSDGERVWSK
jgi:competence protein ComEC